MTDETREFIFKQLEEYQIQWLRQELDKDEIIKSELKFVNSQLIEENKKLKEKLKSLKICDIPAKDIPIGTYFQCSNLTENNKDDIFLKSFLGVVNINNPNQTWNCPNLLIKNYNEVKVEINIKE
jgi:hypothetical protein